MTPSHVQHRPRIASAILLASAGVIAAIGLGAAAPTNASVSGASGSSESGQIQSGPKVFTTNVAPSTSVGEDTKIQVGK
jgi:hypothetical protein